MNTLLLLLLMMMTMGCAPPVASPNDDDSAADDDDSAADDDDSATVADDDDSTPGPCLSWGKPTLLAEVDASDLDELSGLVVSREQPGVLWAIEDSGNPADVLAISEAGAILARVHLEDRENHDWEDLALGPCAAGTCLFVADIGDNDQQRSDIALLRLPEPSVDPTRTGPPLDLTLPADRLPFSYAEGPQNAEALVVEPDGTPVVLTKRPGGSTSIYRLVGLAPDAPVVLANPVELDTTRPGGPVTLGVTGADLLPDGSRLLLREYFDLQEYSLDAGVVSASPEGARAVPFAPEEQGEAVAWDPGGRRYLQSTEAGGGRPPIHEVRCADGAR